MKYMYQNQECLYQVIQNNNNKNKKNWKKSQPSPVRKKERISEPFILDAWLMCIAHAQF